jgi:hypothetical protein
MTIEIVSSGELRRYIRSSVTRAIVDEIARRPRAATSGCFGAAFAIQTGSAEPDGSPSGWDY